MTGKHGGYWLFCAVLHVPRMDVYVTLSAVAAVQILDIFAFSKSPEGQMDYVGYGFYYVSTAIHFHCIPLMETTSKQSGQRATL